MKTIIASYGYLPSSMAHGFLVTRDSAAVLYKITDYYALAAEGCVRRDAQTCLSPGRCRHGPETPCRLCAYTQGCIIPRVQSLNAPLMPNEDLDYELLRELAHEPSASQRSLASRLGISVGKVNYCVRALVDKGWVKANNFRRSDNKWAYTYLLTASGAVAKLRLTKDFLARKEQEFLSLQAEIASLRSQLSAGKDVAKSSSQEATAHD